MEGERILKPERQLRRQHDYHEGNIRKRYESIVHLIGRAAAARPCRTNSGAARRTAGLPGLC
jgi:hypothetical protein